LGIFPKATIYAKTALKKEAFYKGIAGAEGERLLRDYVPNERNPAVQLPRIHTHRNGRRAWRVHFHPENCPWKKLGF
jgi:hypothetical protein